MRDNDEEAKVLRALQDIVDGHADTDEYKAIAQHEEFVQSLMRGFKLPHRQAWIAARQVRIQYKINAQRQGVTTMDYANALGDRGVMSIVGFCIGAVMQADVAHWRDPATGDDITPEYNI